MLTSPASSIVWNIYSAHIVITFPSEKQVNNYVESIDSVRKVAVQVFTQSYRIWSDSYNYHTTLLKKPCL